MNNKGQYTELWTVKCLEEGLKKEESGELQKANNLWHNYLTERGMHIKPTQRLAQFYNQFAATKGRSLNFQLFVSALVLMVCFFILFKAAWSGLFTAHL